MATGSQIMKYWKKTMTKAMNQHKKVRTSRSVANRLREARPSRSFFTHAATEILEYCKLLGLDPEKEKDLLYIAKEGIKAPVPKNWKPV